MVEVQAAEPLECSLVLVILVGHRTVECCFEMLYERQDAGRAKESREDRKVC